MSKVSITYKAPAGDDAVVTYMGVRFFEGQAAKVDPEQHPALMAKIVTNPHFVVKGAAAEASEESEEPSEEKPRRGRPPKAE